MWEYKQSTIPTAQTIIYSIFANRRALTFSQVLEQWQRSAEFRNFYTAILKEAPFEAFFWETPPTTLLNMHDPFEFVLVNSPALARAKADPNSFKTYFKNGKAIVSFPNLRGDAQLIVPCPIDSMDCYTHLATFVRKASPQQIDAFWQTVGKVYTSQLSDKPLWLSTSGLGVSWLHLRIDTTPKYYSYTAYKAIR